MTDFLIAPSEPPTIQMLGTRSSVPEKHGCDILWYERSVLGLVGVQRKEFHDLIASVHDGRLGKEIAQLADSSTVKQAFVIVEGRPSWNVDGTLADRHTRFTRRQYRSLLRSIQHRHIIVEQTDSMTDTVGLVEEIAAYCAKEKHTSLDHRPGPTPTWGTVTASGWASHLLQSVPGIGPSQAKLLYEHFKGDLPIGLTCKREDLAAIKGLGPKRIDAIERAFGGFIGDGDGGE